MFARLSLLIKKTLPNPLYEFLRTVLLWKDLAACFSFLVTDRVPVPFRDRLRIVRRLYAINFHIDSPHRQGEILQFMSVILTLSPSIRGSVIEAGCFKGSSTAKLSLAADLANRNLVVFDSFQGIPGHDESGEQDIFGGPAQFAQGDLSGALDEVKSNVARFGKIDRCRFISGWFDETMPSFNEPVSAIYLDVVLASSTRTCLKYLYPLLEPGGVLISQDGHLQPVIAVFDDDAFWRDEVGCPKPAMSGLREGKIIKIVKLS